MSISFPSGRAFPAFNRATNGGARDRQIEPTPARYRLIRFAYYVSICLVPAGDLHVPGVLGEFEQVVLLAVLRLGDTAAYAVAIRGEIEERTGRSVSRGSVYITLDRLETKGYLRSWLADPTPARGGRAKRYYALRPRALDALRDTREALLAMWRGLDGVLGRA
jgi:PadR family transcriptional regulator